MKRLFASFLVLALLTALAIPAAARPSLTVRQFENKTDEKSVPASAITDMMTTELYEAGVFALMEREKLDYVAEELKLAQSGLMDMSTAPEIGKVKGAQYSMTGAVTQYYYNATAGGIPIPHIGGGLAASRTAYVTLDIRLIDNSTGEVVYAASQVGASNQSAGGLVTKYGGFGTGKYGGVLAAATRKAVQKHATALKEMNLQ